MRVGLLRHFPVEGGLPRGWFRAEELDAWLARYQQLPVVPGEFDLGGVAWAECWSSPLPRARATAERLFAGTVEVSPLFAEVEFQVARVGGLRLPIPLWRVVMELAWRLGHASQRIQRDAFRERVRAAATMLAGRTRDTLVVTHAGMMRFLGAELCRRGFGGPRIVGIAAHARAYVFTRAKAESGASGTGGSR